MRFCKRWSVVSTCPSQRWLLMSLGTNKRNSVSAFLTRYIHTVFRVAWSPTMGTPCHRIRIYWLGSAHQAGVLWGLMEHHSEMWAVSVCVGSSRSAEKTVLLGVLHQRAEGMEQLLGQWTQPCAAGAQGVLGSALRHWGGVWVLPTMILLTWDVLWLYKHNGRQCSATIFSAGNYLLGSTFCWKSRGAGESHWTCHGVKLLHGM